MDDRKTAALKSAIVQRVEGAARRVGIVIVAYSIPCLAAAAWGVGNAPAASGITPMAAAGFAAAILVPLLYLAAEPPLCRRGVRRALSALSREAQVEVLLTMRQQIASDAADIVEPLLREFRVTELLPACDTEGRGSEASPAHNQTGSDAARADTQWV